MYASLELLEHAIFLQWKVNDAYNLTERYFKTEHIQRFWIAQLFDINEKVCLHRSSLFLYVVKTLCSRRLKCTTFAWTETVSGIWQKQ